MNKEKFRLIFEYIQHNILMSWQTCVT